MESILIPYSFITEIRLHAPCNILRYKKNATNVARLAPEAHSETSLLNKLLVNCEKLHHRPDRPQRAYTKTLSFQFSHNFGD